jgi:hypothetical protein
VTTQRSPATTHQWPARGGVAALAIVALLILAGGLLGWLIVGKPAGRGSAAWRAALPVDGVWFEEVADTIGLKFQHVAAVQRHYWFPEIMGGGVCLFDYDRDGDLDAYFVQSGDLDAVLQNRGLPAGAVSDRDHNNPGNQLFRNRGDGTFEDVTAQTGIGDHGYGMGCTCGDFDGDGDVDLFVTNYGPNALYRNNGDGTFTNVTAETGVGDSGWGTSAAFLDYDGDGDLDLYVVNYVNWRPAQELRCSTAGGEQDYCSPNNYNAPAPDVLYRNEGHGKFTDVSEPAGLRRAFGNGLGVAWGDFNRDGRPDIFVANDGMPNQLWINNGDGTFYDEALILGCAVNRRGVAEAGMGVQAVDLDGRGDLGIFVSHLHDEANVFFTWTGGAFTDTTAEMGLAVPSIPFTGFGLGFADFDHDGLQDVYVVNGRVMRWGPALAADPYAEPNQLFRGVSTRRFEELKPRGGTAQELVANSRAAAFGDLDNDGDVDIVIVNNGDRAHVLRNMAGARGQWIMFRVLNRRGADALGATVRIESGGKVQTRGVQVAYSYCASHDPRVHFGLGAAGQVDTVSVRWPNGQQESFGSFTAGALYDLREGAGRIVARASSP